LFTGKVQRKVSNCIAGLAAAGSSRRKIAAIPATQASCRDPGTRPELRLPPSQLERTDDKDVDRFVTIAVVPAPVDPLVEGGEKPRQRGNVAGRTVPIHHSAILRQVSDVIRGSSNDAEARGGAIEVEWRRQYCGIHRA